MKFALKFSISLKIAVSEENPGGLAIFFGEAGKILLYRRAEPLGGA